MLREKLVYLCGPIGGQTFAGCNGWREYVKRELENATVEYPYTVHQEGFVYKDGVPHLTGETKPKGSIIVPKFRCVNPMRGEEEYLSVLKGTLPTRHETLAPDHPLSSDRVQNLRDTWDVKEADVLFVNVTGAKKGSLGSVGEIAIAWWLRKFVLLIAEPGNIHTEHGLVREWASLILPTVDDGIAYLRTTLYA